MTVAKNVAFALAAAAMLIVDAIRQRRGTDDDDDPGLFIGSARPLAAKPRAPKRRRD